MGSMGRLTTHEDFRAAVTDLHAHRTVRDAADLHAVTEHYASAPTAPAVPGGPDAGGGGADAAARR